MIRVTIDLHVVSKGEHGGYWLSTITKSEWERQVKQKTWCKDDGEIRAELREQGDMFMLVRAGSNPAEAIDKRLGVSACNVSQVRGWPMKIDLEQELQ